VKLLAGKFDQDLNYPYIPKISQCFDKSGQFYMANSLMPTSYWSRKSYCYWSAFYFYFFHGGVVVNYFDPALHENSTWLVHKTGQQADLT
jgi:hypothetical protein